MTFRHYLSQLFHARQPRSVRQGGKKESSRRLRLERFEVRCVPATFTVTTLLDNVAGSLRTQIAAANANVGDDTINFSVTGPITLTAGELSITDGVVIAGPGIIINGNNASRVFKTTDAPASEKITLVALTITNGLVTGDGGGIFVGDESITLIGCTVVNNTATGSGGAGGGIAVQASPGSLTVTGGIIGNNHSNSADGGGILLDSGVTATISGCSIVTNTAADEGGGIHSISGSMTLINCTLAGNTAGSGAGFRFRGTVGAGGLIVRNCTISGNTASSTGGGIGLVSFTGGLVVQNSTITANKAGGQGGGGIGRITGTGTINLESSIVSGNTDTVNSNEDLYTTGSVYAKYSAIGTTTGVTTFTPDITSKYLVGANLKLGTLSNNGGATNTHLPATDSPVIDKGSNPAALTTDQRGQPRVLNTIPDIGAVEVVNFVVRNSNDSGKDSLRQMVLDANTASGANTITFDAAVFSSATTIKLTTGEILISESIAVAGAGQSLVTISGNNNDRVFELNATGTPTFTFSDLTVSDGKSSSLGGGFFVSAGIVTLTRCVVSNNTANNNGGAIDMLGNNASLTLTDCTVANNSAPGNGGGIEMGGFTQTLFISGTTFSGNTAAMKGGGINWVNTGSLTVRNSTFSSNTGSQGGGGISIQGSASLTVQNGTFTANSGGTGAGGGINRVVAGTFLIESSILFGDIAGSGPEVFTPGTATVNVSLIGNKTGVTNFIGDSFTTGHLGANPLLGPLANNGGTTLTHLPGLTSPALDNGSNPAGLTTDQRGLFFPRVVNTVADIGAVEVTNLVVRNTNDTGKDSLRQRVLDADAIGGADSITFDPAVFTSAKTITLAGEIAIKSAMTITGPAAKVTISGGGIGRIFNTAAASSGPAIVLQGLSLTNGKSSSSGGAIALADETLTLQNCSITGSSASGVGGAISVVGGSVVTACILIEDCTLSGNKATDFGGGAIFAGSNSEITIRRSTLSGNTAAGSGGAIYFFSGGSLTIEDSTLSGNIANEPTTSGGGGAVYFFGTASTFLIRNSTLSGNKAPASSGGTVCLTAFSGFAKFQNCTIFNNSAGTAGGGIARTSGSGGVRLDSTIVAGNGNSTARDLSFDVQTSVGGDNNLVAVADAGNFTLTGNGNLTGTKSAPLNAKLGQLADNGGPTQTHMPDPASPAVDKGGNPAVLPNDQRGGLRQVGAGVDIGAVERQAGAAFVVDIATDEDDGNTSKGDVSLREAIALASQFPDSTDTISFDPLVFGVPRTIKLMLGQLLVNGPANVVGPGAALLTVSGNDTSRIFNFQNTSGRYDITGLDASIVSGATLSQGTASNGGAIYIGEFAGLQLTECTISGNTATGSGGGISQYSYLPYSLVLTHCLVSGNTAHSGGGIGSASGYLVLDGSTISGNSATGSFGYGGGVFVAPPTSPFTIVLTVRNCTISGNTAGKNGGGLYVFRGELNLQNSTISGNTAANNGGGIYFFGSGYQITVQNSTITANTATSGSGGGIACPVGPATLKSTVVAANTNSAAPDMFFNSATNVTADHVFVGVADEGNFTLIGSGNQTGSKASPLNAKLGPLQDNGGPTKTHTLLAGSPCIDVGSNPANLNFDQRGVPRLAGAAVDVGALEIQPPATYVVDITADENDGNFSAGDLSLREAIVLADASAESADTITFQPSVFALPQTITLTLGEIPINGAVTIVGPADKATIDAGGLSRVFNIAGEVTTTTSISRLVLTNGNSAGANGGAILVTFTGLSLSEMVISFSTALNGGAVAVIGTSNFTLSDSTLSGNSVTRAGGALYVQGGTASNTVTVTGSTVSGNTAINSGGGILLGSTTTANVVIRNCTVSGNSSTLQGGGIRGYTGFTGTVTLQNSTVTQNKATTAAGGVGAGAGTWKLDSVIVAQNTGPSGDLSGSLAINFSLIGAADGATITGGNNVTGTEAAPLDAKLGLLANNGGPTMTHALLTGSPAIDAGNNVNALPNDQRGTGFPRVWNAITDIGAVETLPSFVVRNNNDSGKDSLRQAMLNANALLGTDTITFDPTFFATPRTISLTSNEIDITESVQIIGPGAGQVSISGLSLRRVFVLSGTSTNVALSDMTVTQAFGGAAGSAIIVAASDSLTLDRVNLIANSAGNGAGVYATDATLTIRDCTLANNRVSSFGGALTAQNSDVTIERSTFSSNTANRGGGLSIGGTSALTIRNSTFSSNSAGAASALDINTSTESVVIQNSTFTANSASGSGACIVVSIGATTVAVTVNSSIISGNSPANQPDITSSFPIAVGTSAIGHGSGFPMTDLGGNLPFGADLKLGPLANNGGPTLTHALLAGSPAINAGSNPAMLPNDQRGTGFPRVVGTAADIGAFESQTIPPPCVAGNSIIINDGAAQRSRVTHVAIPFDQIIALPGDPALAFQLKRQSDGALAGYTIGADNSTGKTVVILTFNQALSEFDSLQDGRYTLTIFANQVSGLGGQLDGNCDGTGGDDFVLIGNPANGLFRLFGDADGDGDVDTTDFGAFRAAFGGSNTVFDFDNDGDVDTTDFGQFRARFGLTI